jgi:NADH-quinone oxidoreductase subunit A
VLFDLSSIFFFVVVGLSVPLLMLTAGWLLRPHTPNPDKLATYECGEIPVQAAWFNFNPRFYIVALVFLIFDVEVAFTYPVAVVFRRWVARGAGTFALGELALFVLILMLGLAYVWRRGDLDWVRDERSDGDDDGGGAG